MELAAQVIQQFVLLEVVVVCDFSLGAIREGLGRTELGICGGFSFHLFSKID